MTTRTVPLEPTDEMIEAGGKAIADNWGMHYMGQWSGDAKSTYKAMIAAAPAEPDPAADPRLVREFKLEADLAASQERVRELEGELAETQKWRDAWENIASSNDEAKRRAEQERDALAKDAKRWNALLNCARIRILGKAGFERDQLAYRHIGLEIWTKHPEATKDKVKVQQWLTEFADQAIDSGRDAT